MIGEDGMQILRTTRNEIRRILCSTGFWLSVAIALIILLTSTAHKEEDGSAYTVLSMALQLGKAEILMKNVFAQTLFSQIVRYALPMYGPLLAALSFAVVLCEERKYGVRRYVLFKEGKTAYVLSKALSAVVASGTAFFLATLLFLLFLYCEYPLMSARDMEVFQYWLEVQSVSPSGETIIWFQWFGEHAYGILQLFGVFLYGMFCGFIGYICTAFFSNVYLTVCIPFFFGYIYYSITQALMARAVEGSISWDLYNVVNSYVSPEGYMYYWRMEDSLIINLIALVVLWLISIGIHMLQIWKVADCGVK